MLFYLFQVTVVVGAGNIDELNSRIAELMSDVTSHDQDLMQLRTTLDEKVWLTIFLLYYTHLNMPF